MKNITAIIFIVLLAISIQSLGQKKINKLENYAGKTYWIVEKEGLKGLNSNKGKHIVPPLYDLVLPSLHDNYSFIAKDGKLGLYDNLMKLELVLEANFDAVSFFTSVDNEVILEFYNPYDYTNIELRYVLTRDTSKNIRVQKEEKYVYHKALDLFEENGLEKVDSVHFIHHFSKLAVLSNEDRIEEEETSINVELSFQKTGVYSLATNGFIVVPEYRTIARLSEEDYYENTFYYDFYSVTQLDKASFNKKSKNYAPIRSLHDLYRTGLYSETFKLLVAPQKNSIAPLGNDWYFFPNTNDTLSIYDKKGNLELQLSEIPDTVVKFKQFGDKFYLATESSDDMMVNYEMRTEFYTYYIYTKKGELIKKVKLSIGLPTEKKNVSIVFTQKPDDEWNYFAGFFNLAKAEYVIDPLYEQIREVYYKEGILECEPGQCKFFYMLKKGKEISYMDQNLKPYTPKSVIPDLIYEEFSVDIYGPSVFDRMPYIEIYPIDTMGTAYQVLKKKGIEVKFEIIEEDFFSMGSYVGLVYALYGDAKIVEMYDSYKEGKTNAKPQPTYGLINKNEDKLYLPPFFSKMDFNKENNTLEFTYKGESSSILLERYEN